MVERRLVCLRIALPWMTEAVGTQPGADSEPWRAPAAEWLVARGTRLASRAGNWRAWLLDGIGDGADLLERYPAGPCARALAAGGMPQGTWACARPVHLLTAIDHLQLAPGEVALDPDETTILARDFNEHFAERALKLHTAGAATDWHLECTSPVECESVEPAAAEGRNLRDLMPRGPDGARVRALMNEIQMLLHEHPINAARATRGLPTVNSLWLWGFGAVRDVAAVSLPVLYTDDPWLAGLWRLHGATANALERFAPEASQAAGLALVGWSQRPGGDAVAGIAQAESRYLAPVRELLRRGRIDRLELMFGDRAVVADRLARFRFWRRIRPLQEVLA